MRVAGTRLLESSPDCTLAEKTNPSPGTLIWEADDHVFGHWPPGHCLYVLSGWSWHYLLKRLVISQSNYHSTFDASVAGGGYNLCVFLKLQFTGPARWRSG